VVQSRPLAHHRYAPKPRDDATILVVDDDAGSRLFLEAVLTEAGFHVITAQDGLDALPIIEAATPPDLVVTDLMMPRLDGFALIDRVRTAQVPIRGIIAMSAASVADHRLAGADVFIAKPFDSEQLVASACALLAEPTATAPQRWRVPSMAASPGRRPLH
jgi:DNA-binding response OmpR family regulator